MFNWNYKCDCLPFFSDTLESFIVIVLVERERKTSILEYHHLYLNSSTQYAFIVTGGHYACFRIDFMKDIHCITTCSTLSLSFYNTIILG